jgi:hypothetical protein
MTDKRYVTIDAVPELLDWHRDKKCQDSAINPTGQSIFRIIEVSMRNPIPAGAAINAANQLF